MTVELVLQRLPQHGKSTPGVWLLDGKLLAVSLEDGKSPHPYGLKVKGVTRIPAGRYRLGVVKDTPMEQRYRARYRWHNRGLLSVERVPGYDSIRIHPVNTHNDTEGCLGVAERLTVPRLPEDARIDRVDDAFERLYEAVIKGAKSGDAWVTILDWPAASA